MARVLIYVQKGNKRSQAVTTALQVGIGACQSNDQVTMLDEATYTSPLPADIVCFYGLSGNFMKLFQEYRAKGVQTVFFDLGIWGRKGEKQPDFHRVSIDSYMPVDYFWMPATPDRFLQFEREIKPWRNAGSHILAAGMSDRAAKVWGLGSAKEHADWLISTIRQHTERPIIYTAKALHPDPTPFPNVRYTQATIKDILRESIWMTITYRSHVSVDGLIEGIPTIILGDHPSKFLSHNDLTRIEDPLRVADPKRLEFCACLAHHQISLRELRSGQAWKIFRKNGWIKS